MKRPLTAAERPRLNAIHRADAALDRSTERQRVLLFDGTVTSAEYCSACWGIIETRKVAAREIDISFPHVVRPHERNVTMKTRKGPDVHSAAAILGARGGAAGKGTTKIRKTSFALGGDEAKKAGAAGGAAGVGPSKRRSPEHYRKMVVARARARKTTRP